MPRDTADHITVLAGPIPYTQAGFAAAVAARPDLHPINAIMKGLGTQRRQFSADELRAQRDADLAFWAGLPNVDQVRTNINSKYASRIAAAERAALKMEGN